MRYRSNPTNPSQKVQFEIDKVNDYCHYDIPFYKCSVIMASFYYYIRFFKTRVQRVLQPCADGTQLNNLVKGYFQNLPIMKSYIKSPEKFEVNQIYSLNIARMHARTMCTHP